MLRKSQEMFLFSHLGSCANLGLITVTKKMGHGAGPFLHYMLTSVGEKAGCGRDGWRDARAAQGKVLIPEKEEWMLEI